jgi:hypothetical protein
LLMSEDTLDTCMRVVVSNTLLFETRATAANF